ncbi:MAG: DUF2155 domain-containing protein [Holosporaceae bacterium]|jgi:hypothetical protein|nr:DUF2155 domain-containing protein [Holosporaceae bacterium]
MKRISGRSHWGLLLFFLCIINGFLLAAVPEKSGKTRKSLKEIIQNDDFGEESSIWESQPIEIGGVKLQILDKISGKVYQENIKKNSSINFGPIKIKLKKCFKNGPEDDKEISALLEISEENRVIFSNWLFASSPSVNLFSHPVYDVRIEF